MKYKAHFLILLFIAGFWTELAAYPVDGYLLTGISRLARLQLVLSGEIQDKPLPKGAQKSIDDIELHLLGPRGDSLRELPTPDPELQKKLNALFPNLSESYSITLLDISPNKPVRYAARKETRGFQPGSVGKLTIVAGLFCELENLYPDSFELRRDLLKKKFVKAGPWCITNEHTVPFYDPETKKFFKRVVQPQDVFSLYEWVDHMLSVSSNAAASIVWREVMLMRYYGEEYPELTEEEAVAFFKNTPKPQLTEIAMSVVNDPLRELGITEEEWKLGSLFTSEGKKMVPGTGGSSASPAGLMKYLIAMERGQIVDPASSLEIKRLMYMTATRIRYAASPALAEAAVYFKSGSLYKCRPEEGYTCKKYAGNVENYMNSVAIVEQPDSTVYMVALMSNVLRKNSNIDHNGLASQIDRLVRK